VTICIVDTSIFCNVLDVPGFNQAKSRILASLHQFIDQRYTLLLPLAAVFETGNHIAHVTDGRERRSSAERFVRQVRLAIVREAPWTPTPFPDQMELNQWLGTFPDEAMWGVGMADLSMIKAFERQCELHRARRTFIWSLDQHLSGYDRAAIT